MVVEIFPKQEMKRINSNRLEKWCCDELCHFVIIKSDNFCRSDMSGWSWSDKDRIDSWRVWRAMAVAGTPWAKASVMNPARKEWEVPIGRPVALQALLIAWLCVVLPNEKNLRKRISPLGEDWNVLCIAARIGSESNAVLCVTIENLGRKWFLAFLTVMEASLIVNLKSPQVKLSNSEMRSAAQQFKAIANAHL